MTEQVIAITRCVSWAPMPQKCISWGSLQCSPRPSSWIWRGCFTCLCL